MKIPFRNPFSGRRRKAKKFTDSEKKDINASVGEVQSPQVHSPQQLGEALRLAGELKEILGQQTQIIDREADLANRMGTISKEMESFDFSETERAVSRMEEIASAVKSAAYTVAEEPTQKEMHGHMEAQTQVRERGMYVLSVAEEMRAKHKSIVKKKERVEDEISEGRRNLNADEKDMLAIIREYENYLDALNSVYIQKAIRSFFEPLMFHYKDLFEHYMNSKKYKDTEKKERINNMRHFFAEFSEGMGFNERS